MKFSLRWALALSMLSPSTMACAGSLPTGFTVGYNEAWTEGYYSNWLASNNMPGLWGLLNSAFNSSFVDAMFSGMAQGNAKIVRIWLFPNMQGVAIDPSKSPQTQGLYISSGQQVPEIITNLNTVFQLANRYGLKLYITALDGDSMRNVSGSVNTLHTYYQMLTSNSAELTAYEQKVLAPLLNWIVASGYTNLVYAFDLVNEIEAPINAGYFPTYWSGARSWISSMAYVITYYYPWLPVTSTAGWGNAVQEVTLGLFSGLKLNFYDVHVYSDSGSYSGQTALCNKAKSDNLPIILGEFGQNSSTVSDSTQNIATYNFLTKAKGSCFSSALAWKYEGAYNPGYPLLSSGEPRYSYLYVNVTSNPSTNGTLSTACSPQLPGPSCPRPAYTTIKNFH